MSTESFVAGFVKRAAEYGIDQKQAGELLKAAGMWGNLWDKAKLTFAKGTPDAPYPLGKREAELKQTLAQPASSPRQLSLQGKALPQLQDVQDAKAAYKAYNQAHVSGNAPGDLIPFQQKAEQAYSKVPLTSLEKGVRSAHNVGEWMGENPSIAKGIGGGLGYLGYKALSGGDSPAPMAKSVPPAPGAGASAYSDLFKQYGLQAPSR